MTDFDCIVVGAGPGGYVAAARAAQLGLRTAVVERSGSLGGRCLNVACIPAKTVLRSADVLSEVRAAAEFGVRVEGVTVDFPAVAKRRDTVIATLTGGVRAILRKHGVTVIAGTAAMDEDGALLVGGDRLRARAVILATGSVPREVPGLPLGGRVIGTEQAWALHELPASLAVAGAGASGTEIASAYARLGVAVQLFESLPRVLPGEDAEISAIVRRSLARQGVDVHTGVQLTDVSGDDHVRFRFGDTPGRAEWLVVATGRAPDTAALGLRAAGVAVDARGFVVVDDQLRTARAGVYAIGDLVTGPALAHKASEEGITAAESAAGLASRRPAGIPRVTFCEPAVGSFGLTEEAAREQGHDVITGRARFGAVGAGTVYGDRTGLVKIVGDRRTGELLGGHVAGPRAPELVQQLVNVHSAEAGYADLARTVHGHPALSEALLEAARDADGWAIHG